MTYQKVKPLGPADVRAIRTLVDTPLPTVPVEIINTVEKLKWYHKLQEYYHTVSVAVMGFALYLIDYSPILKPLLPEEAQTTLSTVVVLATLAYNFFKSNATWLKQLKEPSSP
jgi:hypothetical protein